MTGPDYDEDGPEQFRPVPHPDDRLWRHPSEIAAMKAAHANAETAKVPVVEIVEDARRSKLNVGLMVAAGVVVVGAAALSIGVISGQQSPSTTQVVSEIAGILPVNASGADVRSGLDMLASAEVSVEVRTEGEDVLSVRIHGEVAASLPRIQAVTPDGMREGSGLFVTDDGHIATSAGLIESADYVLAWTEDGQRWKAHIIATDAVSDIAVIQIDSADWPGVSLGSAELWNGQYALALDHEEDSISIGEVTAVSAPLLEIDQPAAVPGSAIVDDTGAVIAMVVADGTNNHATPAWMLEQVAVDLISSGTTTHVWLGVGVSSSPGGDMVVIEEVLTDSPATQARLHRGDLIDSFNGNPVPNAASLHRQVQNSEPGADAVLTVTRDGSRRLIIATLAELPE